MQAGSSTYATIFPFLLILVGLTIENGVNYYASKKEIDDKQLTWFALVWSLMVAVVVFVGLWFYFGRYKNTTVITRAEYLYFGVCYIVGIQLTNFFTVLFYSKKNFFLPNCLMVVLNVVFIMFIPKQDGVANSNPAFIINLYFAYFVLTGLVLTTAFILKNKSWQNFSLPGFAALRLLIRYAILALAANIIFFLVYRIDYWFVNRYCTAEELGNYIQVSKLAQMLLIIPTIISSVVFPHTAGGMDLAKMKDNIFRIGRFTTMLYAILFIIVLAAGNYLFPLIFGESYQLMNVPFLILIPGIWALSNLFILSAYFGGVNKVKVNIIGACIGLVLILAGDIIFIPLYGMYAAAIVSTVGYIATFLFSFSHIRKEYSVSITRYLSIKKDDIKWLQQVIKR